MQTFSFFNKLGHSTDHEQWLQTSQKDRPKNLKLHCKKEYMRYKVWCTKKSVYFEESLLTI